MNHNIRNKDCSYPVTGLLSAILTGVAKGGTRGSWPPCLSASKKKKGKKGEKRGRRKAEKKEKKKVKGVGNWSIPLNKLPIIMALFNVQEMFAFRHEFSKNLPTVGGQKNLPTVGGGKPPSHSLALAPVDKSWVHHCHWHIYIRGTRGKCPP